MLQGLACRLKQLGGSADTLLNLDTLLPKAESLPKLELTVKEDPYPHAKAEDKQDNRAILEISPP
jgi:hypothetical protein